VDTGMGLERLLTVLQGERSVFDTDVFRPWSLPGLWPLDEPSRRIVTDHLRSSVVVIGDGMWHTRFGGDANVTIVPTSDLFSHHDRLSLDRFHPGDEGYQLIAERIAESM